MAEKKKSIIEEALLDVTRIQEALNTNAKEILRSVAKEEIDGLVRESLNEDDYEEEDVDDTEDTALDLADAGEEEVEMGGEDMTDYEDEASMTDTEDSEEMSYGGEESGEDYEMDMTGASDDDVIAVYKKLSGDDEIEVVSDNEVHITDPVSGAEYQVKLGGGEAAEMAPEMGLEPEMDLGAEMGLEPEMDLGAEMGAEPEMDLGAEDEYEEEEEEADTEAIYDEGVNEEVVYEITLDEEEVSEDEEITEETSIGNTADGKPRTATSDVSMGSEAAAPNSGDIEGQTAPKDTDTSGDNLEGGFDDDGENGSGDNHGNHVMETEEVAEGDEVTEADEVNEDEISEEEVIEGDEAIEEKIQVGKGRNVTTKKTSIEGAGAKANNVKDGNVTAESVKKYNKLLAESNKIKKQNGEFRVALKKFRQMLGETVVFNTNLTNVTRLFTEHSTTKEEKEAIIGRFDEEVTTIKESKKLFKIIANELASKKPISEAVENKISKEAGSGTSKQLNESTAYVDASTKRIMNLIKRVENPER